MAKIIGMGFNFKLFRFLHICKKTTFIEAFGIPKRYDGFSGLQTHLTNGLICRLESCCCFFVVDQNLALQVKIEIPMHRL